MADDDLYDDELDEDQEDDDNVIRNLRASSRNAKKEAKRYKEEAEAGYAARRELVKLQAGLPDNKLTNLFLDSYDGDLTKDAVLAAAREYELLPPDPIEAEQREQVGQVQQMMQAHDGGTPPAAPGTNDAVLAEIRNVQPGDNAAYEIADILKRNGLYRDDE